MLPPGESRWVFADGTDRRTDGRTLDRCITFSGISAASATTQEKHVSETTTEWERFVLFQRYQSAVGLYFLAVFSSNCTVEKRVYLHLHASTPDEENHLKPLKRTMLRSQRTLLPQYYEGGVADILVIGCTRSPTVSCQCDVFAFFLQTFVCRLWERQTWCLAARQGACRRTLPGESAT